MTIYRPRRCTCSFIHPFDIYGCCEYLFHVLHSCMPILIAGRKLLTRGLLCQLLQQPACNKYIHSNQVTLTNTTKLMSDQLSNCNLYTKELINPLKWRNKPIANQGGCSRLVRASRKAWYVGLNCHSSTCVFSYVMICK